MKRKLFILTVAATMTIAVIGCGPVASTNGIFTNQTANTAGTQKVVIALMPDKTRIR